MNIRLKSGYSNAWQWDLDHRLILEGVAAGTEVHYSNADSAEALVLDAYQEGDQIFADVPNILLQEAKDISVYIYDGHVEHTAFIAVWGRAKPADYIYTETEIKRYELLLKRIPFDATYEGQLLYVVGGVALPLKLGPGLSIRAGVLQINIATSGDAVSINIDDAGILHVYQDGAEVIPVVDDAGDLTWPGLDLAIDDAGDATLQVKEE